MKERASHKKQSAERMAHSVIGSDADGQCVSTLCALPYALCVILLPLPVVIMTGM